MWRFFAIFLYPYYWVWYEVWDIQISSKLFFKQPQDNFRKMQTFWYFGRLQSISISMKLHSILFLSIFNFLYQLHNTLHPAVSIVSDKGTRVLTSRVSSTPQPVVSPQPRLYITYGWWQVTTILSPQTVSIQKSGTLLACCPQQTREILSLFQVPHETE